MKIKHLGIALLIAVSAASCGKDVQKTPEDTARYFLESLAELDFDKAATCATVAMRKQLSELHAEWKISSPTERDLFKSSLQVQIKSVECKEIDGTMTCTVCCRPDGATGSLTMQQVDGRWFVHQN
jgi:predicted outer membrane protein